jgi:hypothetical protein
MNNNKYTLMIENLNIQFEEKQKDCENMFSKYQEYYTKYNVSAELIKQLKGDIMALENQIIDLKSKTNTLEKDEYLISFLNENGFNTLEELYDFIKEKKNCVCNYKNNIYNSNKKQINTSVNIVNEGPSKELRKSFILFKFRSLVNKVIEYKKQDINKNILIKRIKSFLKNNRKLSFDEICNIPLPPISNDEEILLNININSNKKNTIKKKNKKIYQKERNDYGKTDQDAEINKVIEKLTKSRAIGIKNSCDLYNIRKNKNKHTVHMYSYLHSEANKIDNEHYKEILEEEDISDTNIPRFNKYCNILNKIYINKNIYNSDYIFLPGTFANINIKTISSLINKLEELCKNTTIYNKEDNINNNICEFTNPSTGIKNCLNKKIPNSNKCKYHVKFCDAHNKNYSICKECRIKYNICMFHPNCKKGDKCNFLHLY